MYVAQVSQVTRAEDELLIRFLNHGSNNVGVPDLTHYTCECANKKLTIRYCSHFAIIVHYLFYSRYLSKIFEPTETLSEVFKKNNYILIIKKLSNKD